MDDVLGVQVGQGAGDADPDLHHGFDRQRRCVYFRQQRLALDQFHDDIGFFAEIAGGDEFWRMGPASSGRIICSISKLTMQVASPPSCTTGA